MCTGTTTFLTCGHKLIHYTSFCSLALSSMPNVPASLLPKTKPIRPPKPCSTPTGCRDSINDTCSACHPPFRIAQINKQHDALRGMLMAALRHAKTKEEAKEVERLIEEEARERGKELGVVGKERRSGVVVWGPEERWECEFSYH